MAEATRPSLRARLVGFVRRLPRPSPRHLDLLLTFGGVALLAWGVSMIYMPAGFIAAGISFMILGSGA